MSRKRALETKDVRMVALREAAEIAFSALTLAEMGVITKEAITDRLDQIELILRVPKHLRVP